MRRTITILAGLLALSLACDDPTRPLGPLTWGVVEGRVQDAIAGDSLAPAVAAVWRDADGNVAFGIGPAALQAQTDVEGVAGAVVCIAESAIEGDPIIPHARCTATGSNGRATFHLSTTNRAATHRTAVVAEVDGQALTPDTVTIVVEAGPAELHPFTAAAGGFGMGFAEWGSDAVTDAFGNRVPWTFVSDCECVDVEGTLDVFPARRRLTAVEVGSGAVHVLLTPTDTLASGTVAVSNVEGFLRVDWAF